MKTNKYDLIDDYLNGQMSQEEAEDFQRKLKEDPELAMDLKNTKSLYEYINRDEEQEYRQIAEQARLRYRSRHSDESDDEVKSYSIRKYLPWLAAAVIILCAGIYFIINTSNKLNSTELFSKHYAYYEYTIELRNHGDSISRFYTGMLHYRDGDFNKALTSFKMAKENFSQISTFYIGLCYLELDDYKEAVVYLENAAAMKGENKQDAEWYLALAYLANGKTDKTRLLIKEIINNPKHFYLKQAKDLLADME